MDNYYKVVGGILLIAGTTIGAGMLALPVSTGLAGFIPSFVLLVLCWLFMTYTAYLMLEVILGMETETNLISMARKTLGKGGEYFSWVIYLFLLYALTTAYIAGGTPLFNAGLENLLGIQIPHYLGAIPLLILFGYFVYQGTRSVDLVNRLLMLGLLISYVLMVLFLTPHLDLKLLKNVNWQPLPLAVSVVITSFGFHIVIPTLSTYLKRDVKALRFVIFVGSIIPLLVYLIWELLSLGIIPLDNLQEGYLKGINGASLLSHILTNSYISLITQFFAFFAIITSFLGVSLSLTDFLADGLKVKKSTQGKLFLCLLAFLPPLVLSLSDPRAFLSALEYAGAFGVVVLLGLLPALMVWKARYEKKLSTEYRAPGGKGVLLVLIAISLAIMGFEIVNKF